MTQQEFDSLTRRDIQGFCVQDASSECSGTALAEVTAVQRFDVMMPGMYEVDVHLLPVSCMDN